MTEINVINRTKKSVQIKVNNKPVVYLKESDRLENDSHLTEKEIKDAIWFCKRDSIAMSCVIN